MIEFKGIRDDAVALKTFLETQGTPDKSYRSAVISYGKVLDIGNDKERGGLVKSAAIELTDCYGVRIVARYLHDEKESGRSVWKAVQ